MHSHSFIAGMITTFVIQDVMVGNYWWAAIGGSLVVLNLWVLRGEGKTS